MEKHRSEDNSLPDFESDEAFGEWFRRRLAKSPGLETRPAKGPRKRRTAEGSAHWERVRRVEQQLQAASPLPVRKQIEIVRKKEANAFVVPGRYIYITTGLMRRLDTDDAVALIAGHEIAHAELGHLIEFRRRATWKDVPAGDVLFILMYLAQRFVASPENERDADAYGLDLALNAGYDGQKCLEAFAVLERYMLEHRAGELYVHGTDAAHRPTEDAFAEWKARAEVWLYERLTGYPALRERRMALAERLHQHLDFGRAPLLLPGSRQSTASVNAGFLARVEAIDAEIELWDRELKAAGTRLAEVMHMPAYRRLVDAFAGAARGLDGRTAREAELALRTLQDMVRQTSLLFKMLERAREVRHYLSYDNPPQSALTELQALLFGISSPQPAAAAHPPDSSTQHSPHPGPTTTPQNLLRQMAQLFEPARKTVRAVDAAWSHWTPILAELREDLDTLRAACSVVAVDKGEELNELGHQIQALQRGIDADPLEIAPNAAANIRKALASARKEMLAKVVARRAQL